MDYKALVLELLDLPPAASRDDIRARIRLLVNDLTGEWVNAETGEEFFEKEALTSLGKHFRQKAENAHLIRSMSADISRLEKTVEQLAREREPAEQKQIREMLGLSWEDWTRVAD